MTDKIQEEEIINATAIGILNCEDLEFIKRRLKGFQNKTCQETMKKVLELVEELINKCNRENPLDEYWVGQEIGLDKIKSKLEGMK